MRKMGMALGCMCIAVAACATDQPLPLVRYEALTALSKGCPSVRHTNEIVVCGDRDGNLRYRIEPAAPAEGNPAARSVSRERNALFDYDAGGIGTCSTVGPGGWTGCTVRNWKHAREQEPGNRPPKVQPWENPN